MISPDCDVTFVFTHRSGQTGYSRLAGTSVKTFHSLFPHSTPRSTSPTLWHRTGLILTRGWMAKWTMKCTQLVIAPLLTNTSGEPPHSSTPSKTPLSEETGWSWQRGMVSIRSLMATLPSRTEKIHTFNLYVHLHDTTTWHYQYVRCGPYRKCFK